jgi:hypothetical protein
MQALSPELKLLILRYLDPKSLCRVSRVSRSFRDLASADTVWKQWVSPLADAAPPFKKAFRVNWMRKRAEVYELREREEQRRLYHAQFDARFAGGGRFEGGDLRGGGLPGFPNGGIVGGDHDLGILGPAGPMGPMGGAGVPFGGMRGPPRPGLGGGFFPPFGPPRGFGGLGPGGPRFF